MPTISLSTVQTKPCPICEDPDLFRIVSGLRSQGHGYKRIWRAILARGAKIGHHKVQDHCAHVEAEVVAGGQFDGQENVMRAIGQIEDEAEEVTLDWFARNGIELPPGFVAGTIEVRVGERKHWLRVKPEEGPDARIEIRQAQPVEIIAPRPSPTVFIPGNWKTWVTTPDMQVGYYLDTKGKFHCTQDERAIDLTFQIATVVAEDEGLWGWLDVGDTNDSVALSHFEHHIVDMYSECVNRANQRVSDIFAVRRFIVGETGPIVVTSGNHEIRWPRTTQEKMPYLVGLRRADDPEDEHPIMSVPYLCRFREKNIQVMPSYPRGYYVLNSNLVAFHAPAYGSKALETARRISSVVHASVVFGHTHRRESFAHNIETMSGQRTMEIWSDGTLARLDGAVPSSRNTFDDRMNRLTKEDLPIGMGLVGENWHQGMSVLHVEEGGRERFSREPVAIWSGWAQFRGQALEATCDVEGNALVEAA